MKKMMRCLDLINRKGITVDKQLIIGLGPGRCGTTSLAKLLDLQPDTSVGHEMFNSPRLDFSLSYVYHPKLLEKAIQIMSRWPELVLGDVAYYWLNHVTPVLEDYTPDAKFICLTRNKEDIVESFFTRNDGHPFKCPINVGGLSLKVKGLAVDGVLYPASDSSPKTIAILKEGVGYTWEYYRKESEILAKEYPDNFKIFPMEALNKEDTVKEILDFAGFPEQKQVVKIGIWENKRRALLKEE